MPKPKPEFETATYRLHRRFMDVVDARLKHDYPNATPYELAKRRRYFIDDVLAGHADAIDAAMLQERVAQCAEWIAPSHIEVRVGRAFGLPEWDAGEVADALMAMDPEQRESKLQEIEEFFGARNRERNKPDGK